MPIDCRMAGTTSSFAVWRSSGFSTSGRPATASTATVWRGSTSINETCAGNPAALQAARCRLEKLIARTLRRADDTIPKDIPHAELVHAIAQHLEPLEKQALLECNSLLERCEALVELLEMRMMHVERGKARLH